MIVKSHLPPGQRSFPLKALPSECVPWAPANLENVLWAPKVAHLDIVDVTIHVCVCVCMCTWLRLCLKKGETNWNSAAPPLGDVPWCPPFCGSDHMLRGTIVYIYSTSKVFPSWMEIFPCRCLRNQRSRWSALISLWTITGLNRGDFWIEESSC